MHTAIGSGKLLGPGLKLSLDSRKVLCKGPLVNIARNVRKYIDGGEDFAHVGLPGLILGELIVFRDN